MSITRYLFILPFTGLSLALVLVAAYVLTRGRGRWAVLGRACVLLLAQVMVVASVGLFVNRPTRYLQTVSDVFQVFHRESAAGVTVAQAGVPPRPGDVPAERDLHLLDPATAPVPAGAPEARVWRPHWKSGGHGIFDTVFLGPTSQVSEKVRVWVPDGFDPAKPANVLMFLHGFPGTTAGVLNALRAPEQINSLLKQGLVTQFVMVIPELNIDGREPSCADLPGKPQVQQWLGHDIVKMLRTRYPNLTNRRVGWFVAGDSSGAYCAGRTALIHAEVFGIAGVMSGYDFPQVGALGRGSLELARANTLSNMVARKRAYPAYFYVFGSQSDPDSVNVERKLKAAAKPTDVMHTHLIPRGGHNWQVWQGELPRMLAWWGQMLLPDHQPGADVARVPQSKLHLPVKPRPPRSAFRLVGPVPVGVAGLLALIAFVACLRYGPRLRARRRDEDEDRSGEVARPSRGQCWRAYGLRLALVATSTVLFLLAALLQINRWGQFYANLNEVWAALAQSFT